MPTTKPPYPVEFKQQMVELVRAGRSPAELGREFKCSAQSISTWVARAAADKRAPQRSRTRERDVLSSVEREELARLCQGSPNFPQCGRSNFPTRLRRVVVV